MIKFFLTILFLLPVVCSANLELKSKNAVLIDAYTGQILYKKDAFTPVPPSSMSKLMTGYLLLEAIKNNKIKSTTLFSVSKNSAYKPASGESAMYLSEGTKVSALDLFKGIMIMSGGDACRTVAEGLENSVENFVKKMNLKAKKLGLRNSTFVNPTGMAEENQLMSVYDVAKLSRKFMLDFPEYYSILKEKFFDYKGYSEEEKKEYEFAMWNRNRLLWIYKGADGLKTGHTDKGGYSLASSAKRGERKLIAVINGLHLRLGRNSANRERAKESARLLDYGFQNFKQIKFFEKDKQILEIPVWFGKKNSVKIGANQNIFLTIENDSQDKIEIKAIYNSPFEAPIKQGEKIGDLKILKNGKIVASYDLVSLQKIKRIRFGLRLFENIKLIMKRFL